MFSSSARCKLFLLLIAIPVIRLLYELVLLETGLGSIAYDRISHVLRNPLADLTLLLIAGVAVVAITGELITLFVLGVAPSRRRLDLVPAGAAPDLGNDQETGSSAGPVDDHLFDLVAATRPARIDIDVDQEGRGATVRQ